MHDFYKIIRKSKGHAEFETFRNELNPTIPTSSFVRIIQNYEQIARTRVKLSSYPFLHFSEDTADQSARTFKARVEEIFSTCF